MTGLYRAAAGQPTACAVRPRASPGCPQEEASAACAGAMTMTWEVTAADAGTRVDIVAEDVPDGISAEDHAAGLACSLANLAAYVEQ